MIWVFNISAWKIHRKNKVKVFFWCSSSRTAAVCISPEQGITEDIRAFGVKEQFWCLRGRTCLRFCLPRAEFLPSPQPHLTESGGFPSLTHDVCSPTAALTARWGQAKNPESPFANCDARGVAIFFVLASFFLPSLFLLWAGSGPRQAGSGRGGTTCPMQLPPTAPSLCQHSLDPAHCARGQHAPLPSAPWRHGSNELTLEWLHSQLWQSFSTKMLNR